VRLRLLVGLSAIAIVGNSIAGGSSHSFQGRPAGTDPTEEGLQVAAAAPATQSATAAPITIEMNVARTVTPPETPRQLNAAPAPSPAAAPAAPLSLASLGMFITNAEPLPPCGYSDVPAPLSSQSQWALTMMDTTYALTAAYAPANLVPASNAGVRSREPVRSFVIPDLKRMAQAAAAANAPLSIASGYRSFHNQSVTFRHWQNLQGRAAALISSARPGHSEHQLGTAMDFKARGGTDPWNLKDWGNQTAAGVWLGANAWRYGFIMSYPRGMIGKSCYEYEPWHFRYVGVAEAGAVHSSGLVLRQWLWEHQPNPEVPSP
jgi:D-alanyl-D-alanine carboxypeptidase